MDKMITGYPFSVIFSFQEMLARDTNPFNHNHNPIAPGVAPLSVDAFQ